MRKSRMVFGALIVSIIIVTLMMSATHVQALNKIGPVPIPGDLIPHPNTTTQDTQNLINTVNGMNLSEGIANSLDAKLNAAIGYLNSGVNTAAKDSLNAFINEVNAQAGKNLTTDQANQLTKAAQIIINSIP